MVLSSIVHSNRSVTSKQLLFKLRIFFSVTWMCAFCKSLMNVRHMTGSVFSFSIFLDKIVMIYFENFIRISGLLLNRNTVKK